MMDYDEDIRLMLEFKQGNEAAFDTLYRRHAAPLARYFWRSTLSSDLSEELVQETFLKIHRYRSSYSPRASFKTYLYTVARSILIDNWKKIKINSRRRARELDRMPGPKGGPERQAATRQTLDRVMAALLRLPERQRTAISLVRMEGLSYEEAARALGVTAKALKSLLNRARKQLIEQVQP